jgi:GNAT superfamily N-acetyltransferase
MEGVRRVTPDDRPHCLELLSRALEDARTRRGGATLVGPLTAAELLDPWLAPDAPGAVFVGHIDDVVCGLLAVRTATRPGTDRCYGHIDCCYVEEGARGVGVGSALLEAAVGWCRAEQCLEMDSLALPGDRLTKQRLEAAGFTARLLTLSRRLD